VFPRKDSINVDIETIAVYSESHKHIIDAVDEVQSSYVTGVLVRTVTPAS
jgi:hypothetical protein